MKTQKLVQNWYKTGTFYKMHGQFLMVDGGKQERQEESLRLAS